MFLDYDADEYSPCTDSGAAQMYWESCACFALQGNTNITESCTVRAVNPQQTTPITSWVLSTFFSKIKPLKTPLRDTVCFAIFPSPKSSYKMESELCCDSAQMKCFNSRKSLPAALICPAILIPLSVRSDESTFELWEGTPGEGFLRYLLPSL